LEVAALAEEIHSEVLAVTTSYEIPNHDKTGLHEHLTVEEFWASWLHRWDQNLRRWFLHWQWHWNLIMASMVARRILLL